MLRINLVATVTGRSGNRLQHELLEKPVRNELPLSGAESVSQSLPSIFLSALRRFVDGSSMGQVGGNSRGERTA